MIYYTVYRTWNSVNNKYYFGVHKTKDPYDEYLGSGKILKRAINKYGKGKFFKNICFVYDNSEEAFEKEFELIETYREDPYCYNLRQGGAGGFDYINKEGLNLGFSYIHSKGLSGSSAAANEARIRAAATPEQREELITRYQNRCKNGVKAMLGAIRSLPMEVKQASALRASKCWEGKKHNPASIVLMKLNTGEANSQFGSRWMVKEGVSEKVPQEEIENLLAAGWMFGRKEPKIEKSKVRSLTLNERAPEGTKWCSRHKDYLPAVQFHKDQPYCIECRKIKRKEY